MQLFTTVHTPYLGTVGEPWAVCCANRPPYTPSLHYVLESDCVYTENGAEELLIPGMLYLFPTNPDRIFSIRPGGIYTHCAVNFDVVPLLLTRQTVPMDPCADPVTDHLLQALVSACRAGGDEDADARLLMLPLSTLLVEHTLRRLPLQFAEDEPLAGALRYIHAHYAQPIPLEKLAALAHLSPRYFIARFSKMMKQTPHRYILRYRLSMADAFLQSGLSVSETAERVGFPNVYAFSAAYKKQYGWPPGRRRSLSL